MTIAEVTVQYINQRKGNLPASIKDTAGAYYTVSDEMLSQFQERQSYKIEYDLEEARNGKAYKVVKRAKLVGANLQPAPATHRQDVSPDVARRMFVGAWGHGVMANPNLKPFEMGPQAIASLIALLEAGYDMHYAKGTATAAQAEAPAKHHDMNDEITW